MKRYAKLLGWGMLAVMAWLAAAGCNRGVARPDAVREDLLAVDPDPVMRQFIPLDPAPWITDGRGLTVRMERAHARPGDRWIDLVLDVEDAFVRDPSARIELALHAPGRTADPVAFRRIPVSAARMRVAVDLRAAGLREGRLLAGLYAGRERIGGVEGLLEAAPPETPLVEGVPITVDLDVPEDLGPVRDWPVTFGVPFPAGALWDVEHLRLVDGAGQPVAFQAEVTGRWARDGAIQWVRFDALVDSAAGLALVAGPSTPAHPPAEPFSVSREGAVLWVRNSAWAYAIRAGGGLIETVYHAGRPVVRAGARGLYVVDQHGRLARACEREAEVTIETSGPLAVCIRIEGDYRTAEGEALARHITRLEFRAGRPEIEATHTLVLTRDTREVWFREAGWEWAPQPAGRGEAFFSAGRRSRQDPIRTPLEPGAILALVQKDHEQFGGGENSFQLLRLPEDGGEEILSTGTLMGDWAAWTGDGGGLLLSCREAARQHPKAYVLGADVFGIELFSPRTEEELDFRSPALVRRWNRGGRLSDTAVAEIAGLESNAQGWSKTHHLLVTPLAGAAGLADAARRADLHSEPVYARVDPAWTYASRALGPLYPRDPEAFPEAEAFVEAAARVWIPRRFQSGDYGFVDFAAGPHHTPMGSSVTRYHLSYTVRHDLWLVYARGGERAVREAAETSNRTYMDGNMSHVDVPGASGSWSRHKYRGMLTTGGGGWYGRLPYYWGTGSAPERSTSTNLDQFLNDYYLTGYRRAGDIVAAYADGIRRWWEEGRTTGRDFWREKIFLQALTQAYRHTYDERLIPIIDAVIAYTHAPEGVVQVSRDVPHTTINKLASDIQPLVQVAEYFGDGRVEAMARAVAEYLRPQLGADPSGLRHRFGVLADYLFRETGEESIGEAAALSVRRALAGSPESSSSIAVFRLQGIPYALSTLQATGAGAHPVASWVSYQDVGYPVSVIVRKGEREAIRVRYRGGRDGMRIVPLGATRSWLHRVYPDWIDLPYDSEGGAYELQPGPAGDYFFLAGRRVPLVVHAPHYWRPGPPGEDPRSPIYFQVPEDADRPRIFFEGSARLIDPEGAPWPGEDAVHGWQDLPAERPGRWSFIPVENHLVRVRRIPPFFAFRDPEALFVPEDVAWEVPPLADFTPPAIPPDTVFLPGPGDDPERRGLYLDANRTFTLEAGPDHASGAGGLYLPGIEGTVEFWYRPFWGSFDLDARLPRRRYDSRTLATLFMPDQAVPLQYHMALERVEWPPSRYNYSHTLRANFNSRGPSNNRTPGYIRHIFEPGEWVHVAWTWGPRLIKTRDGLDEAFETRIFVNGGRRGQRYSEFRRGNRLEHPISRLVLGGGPQQGVFSDVRISSRPRYEDDFTPPPPGTLVPDRHTRALFTFDGTLAPEMYNKEIGELPETWRVGR